MNQKLLSIVLGSYNRCEFLKLAIASIRHQTIEANKEIIVVDGGSTDGSLQWLLEQKDIITIMQHNRGEWLGKQIKRRSWGYFMNLAFKAAQGKYICMISDDCMLMPHALQKGYELFEAYERAGRKVGALAFYWRESVKDEEYHVGTPMGTHMYVNHGMFLSAALKEINYIDEEAFQFYCADIDLCLRLSQAGYECLESPDSYVEHYPYATLEVRKKNNRLGEQDLKIFLKRWQPVFPLLTNHSVNAIKRKKVVVPVKDTLKAYEELHNKVVEEHKDFFRKPTRLEGYISAVRWHTKKALRRILPRF